jgi:hypothetical protein
MIEWKSSRAVLALSCALIAAGCEDRGIRTYAVRKEVAPPADGGHGQPGQVHGAAPHDAPPSTTGAAASDSAATWTLPAGWSVDPTPRSMRYATLLAGELEVALSRFPGDVGGVEANVNRWRQQLGLEPLTREGLAATFEPVQVDGADGVFVDLRSSTGDVRMIVALLPRADETWFVKVSGPVALVEREEARLRELVSSLRFARAGAHRG